MKRMALLVALIAAIGVADAGPPRKPWMSWQEAMILWQGPPQEERRQEPQQEPKKPKGHKPKPCNCGSQPLPESEVGNAAFQSGDGAG